MTHRGPSTQVLAIGIRGTQAIKLVRRPSAHHSGLVAVSGGRAVGGEGEGRRGEVEGAAHGALHSRLGWQRRRWRA